MMAESNPWVERFAPWNRETLPQLCETVPEAVALDDCDTELACVRLEQALARVFVVTGKTADVLERLYLRARAHSVVSYHDRRSFLERCYAEQTQEPRLIQPMFLTGYAGTGKSCLIDALQRVLPQDSLLEVDEHHKGFPLCAMWRVAIGGNETPSSALRKLLAGCEHTLPRRSTELAALCRYHVHMRGISLIVADEFQFGTASTVAHARLSSTLKELASLGAPLVFVGNYSLGTRLKKRPQEERERLLSSPMVLLPDEPQSEDWISTVAGCRDVAPDVLVFDPTVAARDLFVYTRGLKRLLRLLISAAYRLARTGTGVVDEAALKKAFESTEYSHARETVGEIFRLETTGRSSRADLVCPVDLPVAEPSVSTQATEEFKHDLHRAAVEASLSVGQANTLSELRKAAQADGPKGRKRGKIATLVALQQGENLV